MGRVDGERRRVRGWGEIKRERMRRYYSIKKKPKNTQRLFSHLS
jgi:hypothetical protein